MQHAQEAVAARGGVLQPPHGVCHLCALEGCDDPVYFDERSEVVHEYCCKTHAEIALERGERAPSNRSLQGASTRENRSVEPQMLRNFCLNIALGCVFWWYGSVEPETCPMIGRNADCPLTRVSLASDALSPGARPHAMLTPRSGSTTSAREATPSERLSSGSGRRTPRTPLQWRGRSGGATASLPTLFLSSQTHTQSQ